MDDYVCTLNAETLEVSIKELNEDPKQTKSQLDTFREWAKQQSHLTCPTDYAYLVKFLRTGKFSQLRARQILEGHLSVKASYAGIVADIDPTDPELKKTLLSGFVMVMPDKDSQGRRIILLDYGAVEPDPKKWDKRMVVRTFYCVYYYLSMNDDDLVNGVIIVQDFTHHSMKWLNFWGFDYLKSLYKIWQGNFPGRFKAYHYYNAGSFFEILMKVIRPVLSKKFQDRIVITNTMEEQFKILSMKLLPVEYLPDDYDGPNQGTLRSIIDNMVARMCEPEVRAHIMNMSNSKWKSSKALKVDDVPNESFRQLSVD